MNYNMPEQGFPPYLERNSGESLFNWKERFYREYRQPTILAGLSDLKLSYIEIANPLLFKVIVQKVYDMPTHLRRRKFLFKKIVNSYSPDIPIASQGSIAKMGEQLRQKIIVDYLKEILMSDYALKIFERDFLNYILKNLKTRNNIEQKTSNGVNLVMFLKKILPPEFKNALRDHLNVSEILDFNKLAFRIFMIIRMHQILSQEKLKLEDSGEVALNEI
jgi:hypothetical protein